MTRARDDFERACAEQCEHCRNGVPVRLRPETGEYVHDASLGAMFSHTICGANVLRRMQSNG